MQYPVFVNEYIGVESQNALSFQRFNFVRFYKIMRRQNMIW